MKKFIQLSVVMASAIYLAGCGGGGGSNSSQPSSDAKTVMKIGNETPFDFASVTVQSTNGTAHYFDGQFKCVKTDTNCYLNINQDINESVTLLFKDAQGKLVRAVVVADAPGTYISLYPSAMDMGFYLMSRIAHDLKASSNLNWLEVNDRVQTFFANYDSPDGSLDPYEEVGDYYTSQLIKGVASEAAFLSAFEQRLLNWDIAQNDELPKPGTQFANLYERILAQFKPSESGLISNAYAQEASCSKELIGFLTYYQNLAGVVPIVGDAVAGAAAIGNSYCDDTGAKLDKIMGQLNTLQNSVEIVSKNVTAINKFVNETQINSKTTDFQYIATRALDLQKQYADFVNRNKVKSLQEYFTAKGGWDAALKDGGASLNNLLTAVYKDVDSSTFRMILNATAPRTNFDTYLTALHNLCGKIPDSSDDNLVMMRQQCNNTIQANSGRLVAAQGITLLIAKDVYSVLNAYETKASKTYLLPAEVTSFATAYSDIRKSFNTQQDDMIAAYKLKTGGDGYFNAFAGLNQQLMTSLTSRQCMQDGKDRSNGPSVVGWYRPTTQRDADYIVTKCKIGNSNNRIVARYYHNGQNANGSSVNENDVANVLGVPVARHYVSSGRPLYNSDANVSSENLPGDGSSYIIEAPSLIEVGSGTADVVNPGSNQLYKTSNGMWLSNSETPHWILIPSQINDSDGKPLYHLVAKMQLLKMYADVRYTSPARSRMTCVAAPCRVDPNTDQWLIFHDGKPEKQTLDLRDANKKSGSEYVLRLAPVGQ